MSTRTGEIGTYLMRGERKRETEGDRERRLEREKLSIGLRERVYHFSAQEKDKRGNREKFDEFKKKKEKRTKHDAADAICGIGRVAGPCTRKYPRC